MTDKEIDADIGRMVRQHTENKRTYFSFHWDGVVPSVLT